MQIEDLYNKKVEHNNIIYSIDKIRLKTYISFTQFNNFEFSLKVGYRDRIKKFWLSDRKSGFHYNYNIEFDDFSFYVGFHHNSEGLSYKKEEMTYNFTIEFNPNKAKDNSLILKILDMSNRWYLRGFDLAMDLHVNILDLIVDVSGRHKHQTISFGKDNITHYLGSGDGRVKIYNKKIESDLFIVDNLTRIEVSRSIDDFEICYINKFKIDDGFFPNVYLNKYIFSFSDYTAKNKTLMAILYAVQSGYPLKELTRDYRAKVKEMLEGGSRIKFDNTSALQSLKQTIFYYFMRLNCKQVIF